MVDLLASSSWERGAAEEKEDLAGQEDILAIADQKLMQLGDREEQQQFEQQGRRRWAGNIIFSE